MVTFSPLQGHLNICCSKPWLRASFWLSGEDRLALHATAPTTLGMTFGIGLARQIQVLGLSRTCWRDRLHGRHPVNNATHRGGKRLQSPDCHDHWESMAEMTRLEYESGNVAMDGRTIDVHAFLDLL